MALQSLKKYFESVNREDFIQMLTLPCVVTEKIQASSIHVLNTTEGYKFFKSGQKQELNKIDRTIHRYYENGIKYFESLSSGVKNQMPLDWKFGFDYMVSEQSVDIKYQSIPKNGLMLTHIQVLNPADNTLIKRVVRDPKILHEWADRLSVQRPQVIFNGILSSNQKDQLIRMLEMSENEYARTFESESFTRRLYTIFNENLNRTALNEDLDGEIDSLVINFFDGKGGKNFKIEKNYTKVVEFRRPSDTYQIALLDLVEFFTGYNLESVSLQAEQADERYIELISNVFNAYISKNAAKYAGVNFDSADFNDRPEFSLNTKFIMNEKTIELVNNQTISELYKIALGSFRRKRLKETDIINTDLMEQINTVIDEIEAIVMLKNNESNIMPFNIFLNHQNLKTQNSPIVESIMTFSQFLENKDI